MRYRSRVGELSGGQRQRVHRPRPPRSRHPLFDEPTANIDAQASTSIYELLGDMNDRVTILLISHDLMAISSYVRTVGCVSGRLLPR